MKYYLVCLNCGEIEYFSTNLGQGGGRKALSMLLWGLTRRKSNLSYNNLMNKAQGAKVGVVPSSTTSRFFIKTKKKTQQRYQTSKGDFFVQIHTQNRQKSVTPKKQKQKTKHLKPKKIRFLTEGIQKSTNDWLLVPSKLVLKVSSRISSCDKDLHQNAYELTRTFKKHKKQEKQPGKSRKHSEQIEAMTYQLTPLTKIKMRGPKSHSMSSKKPTLNKLTPGKLSKGSSKMKLLPKTERNSQTTPEPKHFLSPEMVQHQSSYCFQSQYSNTPKKQRTNQAHSKPTQEHNSLMPPKKASHFLFDSQISAFKENSPSQLLRSTVDLLN